MTDRPGGLLRSRPRRRAAALVGLVTVAALATLPVGLFQLPDHAPGWKVTASMLTLGIAGTGLAYVLYYGLLSGAWPFGVVEAVWALVAIRRYVASTPARRHDRG